MQMYNKMAYKTSKSELDGPSYSQYTEYNVKDEKKKTKGDYYHE